jgi:hypothetical protein
MSFMIMFLVVLALIFLSFRLELWVMEHTSERIVAVVTAVLLVVLVAALAVAAYVAFHELDAFMSG